MKILSAAALFLLLSANVATQGITTKTTTLALPTDQAIASEKAIWAAEKEKGRHTYEALLADDYL